MSWWQVLSRRDTRRFVVYSDPKLVNIRSMLQTQQGQAVHSEYIITSGGLLRSSEGLRDRWGDFTL